MKIESRAVKVMMLLFQKCKTLDGAKELADEFYEHIECEELIHDK